MPHRFVIGSATKPHAHSLRSDRPTLRMSDEVSRISLIMAEGSDLPPIPVDIARGGMDLSPVSERGEGDESSLMRRTLHEMGPALTALDTSQSSISRDTLTDFSKADSTASSRMALSDFAPTILHGEMIGMNSFDSFETIDEEMAEEMERVMYMDTPMRSDFVISPPPSGPSSTGQTGRLGSMASDMPLPSMGSTAPEYASTAMTTVTETSTEASTIPAVVQNFRYSTYAVPVTSHPHPPPLQPSSAVVIPDLVTLADAHPPLHGLANKKSTETFRSDTTSATASTASPTPAPEFRLSRQELLLVKQLQARQGQSAMGTYGDKDKDKENVGPQKRRGLRPLQLVSDRNSNRMSAPLPLPNDKVRERERGSAPKLSNETRKKMSSASGRAGRGGKASKASKASKTSQNSGMSGLRI